MLTDLLKAEGLSLNFFSLHRVTDTSGGGVAIFTRFSLKWHLLQMPRFNSFEVICLKLNAQRNPILLCLYRRDAVAFSEFIFEFTSCLLSLLTLPSVTMW